MIAVGKLHKTYLKCSAVVLNTLHQPILHTNQKYVFTRYDWAY